MKKYFSLFLLVLVSVIPVLGSNSDTTILKPKPHFSQEAQLISNILDTYHFKKIRLNDSLSAVILEDYINTLDNNHSYFLQSDIESFQKYKTELDDLVKSGDLTPAYEIYYVFKERFHERMDYVMNTLIPMEFDYTIDESYSIDRSKAPWAASREELNELWRKIIKSQALSMKLGDRSQEEIKENLTKRYQRFEKAIRQYHTEDIFELYMNAVAEAFDPHTNYFSPRTSDRFEQNMSLSLEGIGARLQSENDYTKVVQILPGGPAEKSNKIHENDRIIGVAQGKD
ncbi:MAG: PDZ domain-containing protein, partial [Fulvivirga sp.]|nr:PDZ domain-containing protein [Fulvivirga sp.]